MKYQKEKKKIKPLKVRIYEFIKMLVIAVVIALFIRTFIVQAYKIPSESMHPTLKIGDHLFVLKFMYGIHLPFLNKTILSWNKPKRGDIIVFSCPVDRKKDYIKRVIGLPGEEILIRHKQVYINGKPLEEKYKVCRELSYDYADEYSIRDNWEYSREIPENSWFVMGDNRDNSQDSRFWGPVDINLIKGKAFVIYWPPWRIRLIK
jgi:signal peptidase I